MKVVKAECWKCTDESIHKNKKQAEKHQAGLNALHELAFLVQDECSTKEEEDYVYEFVQEHAHKLSDITSSLKDIRGGY